MELNATEKNKTWQITNFSSKHKGINLRWVFKLKKYNLGKMMKHKAGLLTKGLVHKKESNL